MITEDRTDEVSPQTVQLAALRLFGERGFAATSMADVARAAGVDIAQVYRLFATKADLIWYGYDATYELLVTTLRAHHGTGRVGDAIRAALRAVFQFEPAENDDLAAQLEAVDRNPELSAESEDRIAGHKQAIITFIAEEIGQRPDDLTPRLVGDTLVAATLITTRHWSNAGDPRVPLRDAIDAAVAPLLEGFADLLARPADQGWSEDVDGRSS